MTKPAMQRVRIPITNPMPVVRYGRIGSAAPKPRSKPDPIKRPHLCLLVKSDGSPEWGAVSVIRMHEYTSERVKNRHMYDLEYKKIAWMQSNYFGGTASFRIGIEMRSVSQIAA